MDLLNGALNRTFDVLLAPLELLGAPAALVLFSGFFGVFALWAFKRISWQSGIRKAKDRIKAHMIAIRIWQDDLRVVGRSFAGAMLRNAQYLGLNFGPFVPLAIPFVIGAAQLVVRYAYDPVPLSADAASLLPGQGTLVEIELWPERRGAIADLRVDLPPGLRALSPLVRSPAEGRALMEVVAVAPGVHRLVFELPGEDGGVDRAEKLCVAGALRERGMQPRRVSSRDWWRIHDPDRWPFLWPAEEALPGDSAFRSIALGYPHRRLAWLPDGELGILVTFLVASMVFGAFAIKPLGVQI